LIGLRTGSQMRPRVVALLLAAILMVGCDSSVPSWPPADSYVTVFESETEIPQEPLTVMLSNASVVGSVANVCLALGSGTPAPHTKEQLKSEVGQFLNDSTVSVLVTTEQGEERAFCGPSFGWSREGKFAGENGYRFGFIGRLIWGLTAIEAADRVNTRIRRNKNTYHYTSAAGFEFIMSSGEVINPSEPIGGPTWWTQAVYPTNKIATELLALCGDPRSGYFIVNLLQTGAGPLTVVQPKLCEDGSYPQGGGFEQIAPSPVNARPLRYIPILQDFEEDFIWN
jgi:hypothetical protein